MISFRERCFNSIAEIEYSDSYSEEDNYQIFNQAISILSRRAKNDDSEFTDNELEILEYTFSKLNGGELNE